MALTGFTAQAHAGQGLTDAHQGLQLTHRDGDGVLLTIVLVSVSTGLQKGIIERTASLDIGVVSKKNQTGNQLLVNQLHLESQASWLSEDKLASKLLVLLERAPYSSLFFKPLAPLKLFPF